MFHSAVGKVFEHFHPGLNRARSSFNQTFFDSAKNAFLFVLDSIDHQMKKWKFTEQHKAATLPFSKLPNKYNHGVSIDEEKSFEPCPWQKSWLYFNYWPLYQLLCQRNNT